MYGSASNHVAHAQNKAPCTFPCNWLLKLNQQSLPILTWLLLGFVFFVLPFMSLLGNTCTASTMYANYYQESCERSVCGTGLDGILWAPSVSLLNGLSLIVIFWIAIFSVLLLIGIRKYCCNGDICKLEKVLSLVSLLAATLFLFFLWGALFFCAGAAKAAFIFAIFTLILALILLAKIFASFGWLSLSFWLYLPFVLYILYLVALNAEAITF